MVKKKVNKTMDKLKKLKGAYLDFGLICFDMVKNYYGTKKNVGKF